MELVACAYFGAVLGFAAAWGMLRARRLQGERSVRESPAPHAPRTTRAERPSAGLEAPAC